jgi:hypothetical protein
MMAEKFGAITLLVAALGLPRTASATTLHTPPMQAGTGQMLVCTVSNVSGKALGITAQLMDRWANNVTCFLRTDWDETETILLTLHAEATDPNARYCKVTVKGGRKADVVASIQACTYDMTTCTSPVPAR